MTHAFRMLIVCMCALLLFAPRIYAKTTHPAVFDIGNIGTELSEQLHLQDTQKQALASVKTALSTALAAHNTLMRVAHEGKQQVIEDGRFHAQTLITTTQKLYDEESRNVIALIRAFDTFYNSLDQKQKETLLSFLRDRTTRKLARRGVVTRRHYGDTVPQSPQ